jgi:hypothetical protein
MSLDEFKTQQGDSSRQGGSTSARWTKDKILKEVKKLNDELEGKPTMRDAMESDNLPSAGTLNKKFNGWNNLLEEAEIGSHHTLELSEDEIIQDLQKCYSDVEGYLTSREYINIGQYSHSAVKRKFGSWKEAAEAAGIKSGSKHGEVVECQCGCKLDSMKEKVVGDLLHDLSIQHEIHKDIPESDFITDFFIPRADVWLEVDGYKEGERPERSKFDDKLDHYDDLGIDYIVLSIPHSLEKSKLKQQLQEALDNK